MDALAEIHHQRHVVLDDEDAAIVFGPDANDNITQFFGLGGGEPGRRLVEEEKARICRQRAGKTNPPLLAVT